MPINKERAIKVSKLSEKSKISMAIKTEMIEAGIATKTVKEFRILCKKINIINATSNMARPKSSITALAEAKVYVELSEAISNFN